MGRGIAAYLARCKYGFSATEIAEHLGYAGPSSVCMAIRRVESNLHALMHTIEAIEAKIAIDY